MDQTLTPNDFEDFASYGEHYAPWFQAMAGLQRAIDANQEDAMEGLTLSEQVDALENRIAASISRLRASANAIGY